MRIAWLVQHVQLGTPQRLGASGIYTKPITMAYTAGGDSPDSTGSSWLCLSRGRTVKL